MDYIILLRQSQTVRVLTAVQVVAYFGSWFSHVAILTLLANLGASPFLIAIAVSLMFLPALIQGPFTGALVDRLEPKKLMNTLLLIEAACTIGFVFINESGYIWLLLALVYIKMSAARFYFTSEMSLMPKLLDARELKLANEIHSIVWSVSFTVGMALSGLAVEFLGINAAFLIDASLFIVAVFIFSMLNINVQKPTIIHSFLDSFKAGIRYVFVDNRKLLPIMALHATVGFTIFDAIITVLAQNNYSKQVSIPLAIGFISAIRSLALMIGPFLFSKFVNRSTLFYMLLGQGAAIALWGVLSGSFWLSLIGSFFCGLFTTTLWSYTMTMLQESIGHEYYGRVVSINDMFFTATTVATSFAIGALMDAGMFAGDVLFVLSAMFFIAAILYKTSRS